MIIKIKVFKINQTYYTLETDYKSLHTVLALSPSF